MNLRTLALHSFDFWRQLEVPDRTACSSPAILVNEYFSNPFRGELPGSMCEDVQQRSKSTTGPRTKFAHGPIACWAPSLRMSMATQKKGEEQSLCSMDQFP